jgi:hypothetical protein
MNWSEKTPDLRLAWDSTSLDAYQRCPRYYQEAFINCWATPRNVHTEYGGLVANGLELYQVLRVRGATREEAAAEIAHAALLATWNEDGTQWGGEWATFWRCKGETKYKNDKGNAAKCPFSHKGKWFPPARPDTCGRCGSNTEEALLYTTPDPAKNRLTLIRALVWYALSQPENLDDGLRPVQLADGTIAAELSWSLPLPLETDDGEPYVLCGHFDYLGQFGDEVFPVDNKTTKTTLNNGFWRRYSPSVQFDTYAMAAPLVLPDLPVKGVAVDAIQTLVGGTVFDRHFYHKAPSQNEEHWQDIAYWIKEAERSVRQGYFRMNKTACAYCPFNMICSAPVEERKGLLEANFVKRDRWNPLTNRGTDNDT